MSELASYVRCDVRTLRPIKGDQNKGSWSDDCARGFLMSNPSSMCSIDIGGILVTREYVRDSFVQ